MTLSHAWRVGARVGIAASASARPTRRRMRARSPPSGEQGGRGSGIVLTGLLIAGAFAVTPRA